MIPQAISIPKWEFKVFVIVLLLALGCFSAGFITDNYFLLGLPVLIIGLAWTILDYKSIYYIFLFLLPLSREVNITSSFSVNLPSEPLILLLGFAFLMEMAAKRNYDLNSFFHPLILLVFVHLVFILLPIANSINYYTSIKFYIAKALYVLTFIYVTGHIVKGIEEIKKVIWAFLLGLLIAVLYTLAIHSQFGFSFEDSNEASWLLFMNHVNYGATTTMAVPLAFFLRGFYPSGSTKRFLLNVAVLILLAAVFTSYTRTSWLSLIAIILIYFIIKWKMLRIAISIGVITGAILLFYFTSERRYLEFAPDYKTTVFHDGDIEGHLQATYSMKDVSGMERVNRWVAGGRLFSENVLLGTGPTTFYPEYKKHMLRMFETYVSGNPERSTTHNYFLMVAIEQGVFGLLLILSFFILLLLYGDYLYRKLVDKKMKNLVMGMLLCVFVIMIHIMLSDLMEVDKIGSMVYLVSVFLASLSLQLRKEGHIDNLQLK